MVWQSWSAKGNCDEEKDEEDGEDREEIHCVCWVGEVA